MSKRNENWPGYKKTKVGWIPDQWYCVSLSDVATVQTGLAKGKKSIINPIKLPYLRVANVQDGLLDLDKIKKIQVEANKVERYLLRNGDILFTEGGDFDKLGRGTIWRDEIPKCLHQNHVFAVRCDTRKLFPYFLASIASSPYGRRYFLLSSKQSTNLASINTTQLKRFPFPLPSIFEQEKIAEILSTWDVAVEQTRKLIEAKKRLKKALMQQLITGRIRFPKFGKTTLKSDDVPTGWQMVTLQNCAAPIKRKNIKGIDRVLTASGEFGLIDQNTFFNRSVAGQSLKDYYLLKKGEFAYKRSSMKNYPYGAIKRLDRYEEGVLSTLYICFSITNDCGNSDYFKHLFESGLLNRELRRIAQVGARAYGLLNVTLKDFFSINVPQLSHEEQRRIAQVLSSADNEIHQLEKKLKALEKQKRGLMQKLLTGEIRVKVNDKVGQVKEDS
ncbi:MAG: restriction endonuclease subunit S [Desulfobacterales bacterium]